MTSSLRLESPRFPRFNGIVDPRTFEVAVGTAPTNRRSQGLFDGLLGGDVAILHADATENPDKYDDQTVGLMNELVQGRRKSADLTEAERGLLDLATIVFSSYVPPKKTPKLESPTAPRMQKIAEEDDDDEMLFDSDDVPDSDTPTYWWL